MSLTHTPGPWRAMCRDIAYVDGQEWPEEKFLQWEVDGPSVPSGRGEFYQADALLIAAAPELLAALQTIMLSVAGCERDPKWEAARAAIAKATP